MVGKAEASREKRKTKCEMDWVYNERDSLEFTRVEQDI